MATTRTNTQTNRDVLVCLGTMLESRVPIDTTISSLINQFREQLQKNAMVNESIYKMIFITELIGEFEQYMIEHSADPAPKEFFQHLQQFLVRHWAVIRNDSILHYQYNPTSFINKICIELALLTANALNLNCGKLLYPELENDTSSVTWTSIVELDRLKQTPPLPPVLPNVVLSDCGKYFIEIDVCFKNAIADGVLKHTQKMVTRVDPVTSEKVKVMALLSPMEIDRVTSHNRYAAHLYQAISDSHRCKYSSPTVGSCIAALIAGLKDGSVNRDSQLFRTGQENLAGLQANAAISAFCQIIDGLPKELRAELSMMRDAHHDFSFHMNSLTNNDHARKISDKQTEIDQLPRAKAFQQAQLALERLQKQLTSALTKTDNAVQLVKLRKEEETLSNKLAETKACLDAVDEQKLEELTLLSTQMGGCVALTALGWQGLLDNNRDRLYSMTFDGSVGVSSQLVVMETRVEEYFRELTHYLDTLYPYLQSLDGVPGAAHLPNEYVNFRADCHQLPNEYLYAIYILKWLAASQSENEVITKLGQLVNYVKHRPQQLIDSGLLSRLTDEHLRLLVVHFATEFTDPIISAICEAGQIELDKGQCCRKILDVCVASPHTAGFLRVNTVWNRSRYTEVILLSVTRLLFAIPDINPLLDHHGHSLLSYAVEIGHADLITLLLAKGASPKIDNRQDVMLDALRKADIEVLKALLPVLQLDDVEVLRRVCMLHGETICELFFQRFVRLGKDPLELAETFFQLANAETNERALVFALGKGAIKAVNTPDRYGNTPLMNFVLANQARAVRQLIQVGADIDYLNPVHKCNVLMQAISSLWRRCLFYCDHERRHATEVSRGLMRQYLSENCLILEIILGKYLAKEMMREIKDDLFPWILKHISLEAFDNVINDVAMVIDLTQVLHTALMLTIAEGSENLVMQLWRRSAEVDQEVRLRAIEHARACGQNRICARLALNQLTSHLEMITPASANSLRESSIFTSSVRDPGEADRDQEIKAAQWMLDRIKTYLTNKEYSHTDLNTALIQAYRDSTHDFTGILNNGRLGELCLRIMGKSAIEDMLHGNKVCQSVGLR